MPVSNNDFILNGIYGSEKKEDFETFLLSIKETDYYKFHSKHFKTKLTEYRKTKEHFKKLKVNFLESYSNCLDANFLINNQIEKFDILHENNSVTNKKVLGEYTPMSEKGFIWVTMGEVILIEDFFLLNIYLIRHFPVNIEDLKVLWQIVYTDLEQAAKGCAEGLYVQFLKEKKIEINTPKLEDINEPLPEYEYKWITQKIAWLHELGILKTVLEKSNYNYYIAANIIHSFTDLKPETIRKGLEAIFKPNAGNEKNNPLNNPDNILFVSEMSKKFKLDKEK